MGLIRQRLQDCDSCGAQHDIHAGSMPTRHRPFFGPTGTPTLHEGLFVNKTELVEHIAKNADISKAAATGFACIDRAFCPWV